MKEPCLPGCNGSQARNGPRSQKSLTMIKIFRRLRMQFLTENLPVGRSRAGKLGKYLLYAFGEIILVVIGPDSYLDDCTSNQQRQ